MNTADYLDQLDQWEDQYQPITNPFDPEASWNGRLFETHGNEFRFVVSQPSQKIWTWVESDNGTYLVAGFTFVNRLGYFITEKPWTDITTTIKVDNYNEEED